MGKLHELLAVEGDLRQAAQSAVKNTGALFSQMNFFRGMIRVFKPIEEGVDVEPDERTEVQYTVKETLEKLQDDFGRYLDATLSKEVSNIDTNATFAIGDKNFKLPAPALLNLENRLGELQNAISAIPTLDPAVAWEWDEAQELFKSEVLYTFKTQKVPVTHVAYEATKEHPAQTETYHVDKRIGQRETRMWSAEIPPHSKRVIMERLADLQREVKKARQRANDIEAKDVKIANEIFNYLFADMI